MDISYSAFEQIRKKMGNYSTEEQFNMLEICSSENLLQINLISLTSCMDPPCTCSHMIHVYSMQGFNFSSKWAINNPPDLWHRVAYTRGVCLCVFSCKQAQRLIFFQLQISQSLRSLVTLQPLSRQRLTWVTILKDYHDFVDVFSKSKAGKLSWPLTPTISKSLWMKHFSSLWLIYSLCQVELAALHKVLWQKHCYRVNPSLSLSPWSTSPLYLKKDGSLQLCVWLLRPQKNFKERLIPTLCSFLTSRCTMKGTSLHQDQSLARIPPHIDFNLEMNGRLHSESTMVHLSGW